LRDAVVHLVVRTGINMRMCWEGDGRADSIIYSLGLGMIPLRGNHVPHFGKGKPRALRGEKGVAV